MPQQIKAVTTEILRIKEQRIGFLLALPDFVTFVIHLFTVNVNTVSINTVC